MARKKKKRKCSFSLWMSNLTMLLVTSNIHLHENAFKTIVMLINQHFKLKHIYLGFWSCSVSTQHSQNSGNPNSHFSFHLSLVFRNVLKYKEVFSGKRKNNCWDDGFADRESSMTGQFLWWDTVMSSKCLQLQYCLSSALFNEVNSWL